MSVTSANIDDLAAFVTGTQNRSQRLGSALTGIVNKANVVMPACSGSQHPSTPSLAALNDLIATWQENGAFVQVVHDDLVEANQFDGNGMATVNVAPAPGVLASEAWPPWARAMASTMDSPMPVPCGRDVRLVAARA